MAQDWIVKTILDRGLGHYYRYQITGENLCASEIDRNFMWSVRDLADPRYDVSKAVYVNEIQYPPEDKRAANVDEHQMIVRNAQREYNKLKGG